MRRPTLIVSHNKTLAAQLTPSSKTFFPDNAVEYFVSYLRLLPARGLRAVERHLHRKRFLDQRRDRAPRIATDQLAVSRRDVIVVPAFHAFTGLGSPETFSEMRIAIRKHDELAVTVLERLVENRYEPQRLRTSTRRRSGCGATSRRRDAGLSRARPARGIFRRYRGRDRGFEPCEREVLRTLDQFDLYPAKKNQYVTPRGKLDPAIAAIKAEPRSASRISKAKPFFLEAQRVRCARATISKCSRKWDFCNASKITRRI